MAITTCAMCYCEDVGTLMKVPGWFPMTLTWLIGESGSGTAGLGACGDYSGDDIPRMARPLNPTERRVMESRFVARVGKRIVLLRVFGVL